MNVASPHATDRWTQELAKSHHEPGLRRALSFLDVHLARRLGSEKKDFEILHELHDELKSSGTWALEAGRRWAQAHLPESSLEKAAGYFDWDLDSDIRQITRTVREAPSREINEAVHQALLSGKHPQEVINRLAKTYQIDRARDIARTIMMNLYAKGSLRESARHGYTEAIRIEIDDTRVCPTCKSLNGGVYTIERLLSRPDPLTFDTHPRCRGTFVPVINPQLTTPDAPGEMKHTQSFPLKNGKLVKNAPREYATFLKRFLDREPVPFHVVFDSALPVDSRMGPDVLRIHPRAVADQDPRELILESWAHELWPKYQDRFENEYLLLTRMGLVHPSGTVQTPEEYWRTEFVAWKMNQLQRPFEVLWFMTTVKER